MLQTITKEINGTTFRITPFPAIEAFRIKTKLLSVISPALGKAMNALGAGDGSLFGMEINGYALSEALQMLFAELNEQTELELVKRLLKCTTAVVATDNGPIQCDFSTSWDTKPSAFDQCFQGKLADVYVVVFEVIKANYPDFFTLISGKLAERMASSKNQTAGSVPPATDGAQS